MNTDHHIRLVHGGGGRISHQLIRDLFLPILNDPELFSQNDSAVLELEHSRIAFTTDAFVVRPPFFPGGDIGRLAVCGTVNDLAVMGAIPKYLSVAFILEEGFSFDDLERVAHSIKTSAEEANVRIVTGDTKVVEKGKGDAIFIQTSGIGIFPENRNPVTGAGAKPGDAVLVNAPIGQHGLAVLTVREELGFTTPIQSDVAPLNKMIEQLFHECNEIHAMRDATRGGLGIVLNEIAMQSSVLIKIEESEIPVTEEVRAACELLGLDPLYVANEGVAVIFVPSHVASLALEIMKSHPYGHNARLIGWVKENSSTPRVVLRTKWGTHRMIDWISGEALPRIC